MKNNPKPTPLTRRQFLRGATLSATAFTIVPGAVLGLRGATSPNNKLNLAGIGCGGQGSHDLKQFEDENIVALCDPDQHRAAPVFKRYPQARQFADYHQMLDTMKDIDGVVVATPDHHHAFAAMEALKRGKHVYCEKPLTHSVWESRHLTQAAREAKIATQMGNQGQATEPTRRLSERVWAGAIGKVHEVHIWTDRPSRGLFDEYWPQGMARPKDCPPVPSTLNWDLWVGPAPMRPYHPAYLPFVWRGWWDFGTGALGDIGCHRMDPIFRALKLGAPLTVQASSTRVNEDSFPLASMVTYEFPARSAAPQTTNRHIQGLHGQAAGEIAMPPCKLIWHDGGLRPARPDALPAGVKMNDNGILLIGDQGCILNDAIYPESRAKEFAQLAPTLPRSDGHYKEWTAACRGGSPGGSHFDWAGPLAETVLLGNVALRVQLREELTLSKLNWDPVALRFTNLDEANKFLRRDYRPGWSL